MSFALFLLQKSIGISDADRRRALTAEIHESLGTLYYTELVGSQLYGYPMQVMTKTVKRETAELALVCYTLAMQEDAVENPTENKQTKAEKKMTWDLHFMVGKEKTSHLRRAGLTSEACIQR